MVCTPFNSNGMRGFVCGPRQRRPRCTHCGKAADYLCDHPGCDRPICAECTTTGGPEIDYCRDHQADARQGVLL